MINRIVGFGDSWIHGDGLIDWEQSKECWLYREQNCLIGQLAQCLGIEYDSARVVNCDTSGGSLQSTVWDFAQWAQQQTHFDNTLLVIGLTESSRQSWWRSNANYVHNHTVHPGHEWEAFVKHYHVHSNNQNIWKMNYWTTTEFFHNWAVANSVKLLMFNIFPAPFDSPHVTNPGWNVRGELARLEHTVGNVTAPCKHPNKKGYHLLAKHLHQMLQSSILV